MASGQVADASGDGQGQGQEAKEVQQYKLAKECELRCEAAWGSPVSVKLITGTAEIFGSELPQGQPLQLPGGQKFAVFTWHGATLEVEGRPDVIYTADETPMVHYANVHAVLDARRRAACQPPPAAAPSSTPAAAAAAAATTATSTTQGPRVMVVGPTDSGKTTLARILLSYAARLGWKPTYADVDIGQGSLGVPGTVGATPVEAPIDPCTGIPQDAPLVYFYGHVSPSVNADLYKVCVEQLAAMLERQLEANADARAAGLVINTMGWVEGLGYQLLLHAIDTLKADVILVLGQERLYSMLRDKYSRSPAGGGGGRQVDIVKLPRSGGVVTRSSKFRLEARHRRTRSYYYGASGELSPHASVAAFADLQVFRVGGGPQAPRSALPIGAAPSADPTRVVGVPISRDLLHAVLAVSYAKDQSQLLTSNVAGFIYITDVDMARKKVTYVAPSPGPLPSTFLLAGTITWVE